MGKISPWTLQAIADALKQRISEVCVANKKVICAAEKLHDSEWNMFLENVIQSDENQAPLYLFQCHFSFPHV